MRIKDELARGDEDWFGSRAPQGDFRAHTARPAASLAAGQKATRKAALQKQRTPQEQVVSDILFAFQKGEVGKIYWEIWNLRNSVQNDHNWVWKGAQHAALYGLEACFSNLTALATQIETFGYTTREAARYVHDLNHCLDEFQLHLRAICCEVLPTARRFRENYVLCAKFDVQKMAERAEMISTTISQLHVRFRAAFSCSNGISNQYR